MEFTADFFESLAQQIETRRKLETPRKTQQHLDLLKAHLHNNIVLIPCYLHLDVRLLLHYKRCNFCGLESEISFILLGQIHHGLTAYKIAESLRHGETGM